MSVTMDTEQYTACEKCKHIVVPDAGVGFARCAACPGSYFDPLTGKSKYPYIETVNHGNCELFEQVMGIEPTDPPPTDAHEADANLDYPTARGNH